MCLLVRYDRNSAGEINIDMYIETEIQWRGREATINSGTIINIDYNFSFAKRFLSAPTLRQMEIPATLLHFRRGQLRIWVNFPGSHYIQI